MNKLISLFFILLFVVSFEVLASPRSIFKNGFEGESTPPVPACNIPDGFKVRKVPWTGMWYGAVWPHSTSHLAPIGSFTMRTNFTPYGALAAGLILTTPFVADTAMHRISWVGVQPIPAARYGVPNGAFAVTVSISECPGDLFAACTATLRSGSLFYGPGAAVSTCRTVPGKKYYLTIHHTVPSDPKKNTCLPTNPSKGVRCDSNFSAR